MKTKKTTHTIRLGRIGGAVDVPGLDVVEGLEYPGQWVDAVGFLPNGQLARLTINPGETRGSFQSVTLRQALLAAAEISEQWIDDRINCLGNSPDTRARFYRLAADAVR